LKLLAARHPRRTFGPLGVLRGVGPRRGRRSAAQPLRWTGPPSAGPTRRSTTTAPASARTPSSGRGWLLGRAHVVGESWVSRGW